MLISTLFNNYGIIHLINNKSLFKSELFRPARPYKIIKYNSLSLPIINKKKKVIKLILNKTQKPKTEDLILSNIIIIKGFYINIVLKACLFKTGV